MKSYLWFFSFGLIISQFVAASDHKVIRLGSPVEITLNPSFWGLDDRYRIGDEWGKKPVTKEILSISPFYERMALATGRVRSATGFYLGEFAGAHLMATNHHVCPTEQNCFSGQRVTFPLAQAEVKIDEFIGTWSEIDLAIFTVTFSDEQSEAKLKEVGRNFQFQSELVPGDELFTAGFGIADNPLRKMVINYDSDCKVFSGKGEARFMADPDDINPGTYKAWSFANGCDVSHGDSGSAMVNRKTGDIIGIIWTGRIPKSAKVQKSSYLNDLLANPNEDIWKELSYGVPAWKMAEVLRAKLDSGSIKEKAVPWIEALIK